MKKKGMLLSLIIIFVIGLFATVTFLNTKNINKNKSKEERLKDLINISELDQDFMNKYFYDYKEMAARNNQENILIVISENGIKNTYGAVQVVNAPNHQYFLQYETDKDRKEAYKKLKEDNYLSVSENIIYEELGDPETNNPETDNTGYMSWGINAMGLDYAIDEANDKNLDEVVVAIIDGGLDEDLFNRYFSNARIKKVYNVNGSTDVTDVRGHGTHIAGTIAEGTPSNVKIMPIKTSNGNHTLFQVTGALYYAINNNVDVINISLSSPDWNESSLYQTIESAKEQNIIVVAAAGNNNSSKILYPAGFDNTIGVSNIARNFIKSSGSNFGFDITFAAPGTKIRSIMGENAIISQNNGNNDDNDHEIISGTSMAAPHVAAAAAIVKSYNKDLSFEDTVDVLKSTVDDIGDYGWDKYYGYGMINFRNREFCDGANDNCDKYNVFKSDEVDIDEVKRLEFTDTYIPTYNYGNITNLMDADINIYYTENDYITKKLGELDDVQITGYDAFSYTEQDVNVEYKEKTTMLTVDNRNNTTSGFKYQIVDSNSIKITEFLYGDIKPIRVYIPSSIDGYDVVSLGDSLFEENDFIKSVILPSSVVEIGNSTFKNSNIKSIDIKAESIRVLDNAFYGVKDLQAINAKLSYIGEYAFYNCYTLKDISFSNDLKTIGAYAFNNNNNLKDVTLPNGLTYIGEYAFSNTNIDSIVIPATVSEIRDYTFSDCTNLASLVIENGVEKIGEYAFQKSILTSLNIPASVNSISSTSFIDYQDLKTVTVDVNNNHYRSVNNEIIEIENSKLVFGMTKVQNNKVVAIIPDDIKIIDSYAFANLNLNIIEIPEGVTTIEEYAFYNNPDLEKVYVPKSVTSFATNSVSKAHADILIFWIYSDTSLTNLKQIINNYDIGYRIIDPFDTTVNLNKTNYNAFDTIDTTNLSIVNSYNEKNYGGSVTVREETITNNYTIKYNNGNSLKGNDTSFTISTTTDTGYDLEVEVPITVSKLIPEYTVPNNIRANVGNKLSDIDLPNGFEWMNDLTLNETGTFTYKARYIPEDTTNYETVENIDVTIIVGNNKTIVRPEIVVGNKTYDGTTNIPTSNITISNLESSEYSVVSAISSSADAGEREATIVLRLSNEMFGEYAFSNGKQEKEFTVNFEILKANINVTDNSKNVTVKHDGNSHSVEIDIDKDPNATIKYMDSNDEYTLDEAPTFTNVGTYTIKYKVYINDNYTEYFGQKTLVIEDDVSYIINKYDVDETNKYISKIMVNTEVNNFTPNIILGYGYGIDVDTKTINNKQLLYTGGKTRITHGLDLYREYTNIVIGDINGDGAINSADLLKIRQHLLGTNILTGAYFLSSDINYDSTINSADLLRVRQHLLGTKPIE